MKNKVKSLRLKQGMTQQKLAESVGVTRPNLSNIERGKQIPRVSSMFRIASFFGQPVEHIFFDDSVLQEAQNKPNK